MEMEIQQKINREQSHRMAMQKAKADAALSMTIYQKHVEKTRNQTVEAYDNHEADTESEDEENVCEEEKALKQQLGSLENDIRDIKTDCAAQITEMGELKQTYDFRLRWAKAQWGEEWKGGSPAPSTAEAEKHAAGKEVRQ